MSKSFISNYISISEETYQHDAFDYIAVVCNEQCCSQLHWFRWMVKQERASSVEWSWVVPLMMMLIDDDSSHHLIALYCCCYLYCCLAGSFVVDINSCLVGSLLPVLTNDVAAELRAAFVEAASKVHCAILKMLNGNLHNN